MIEDLIYLANKLHHLAICKNENERVGAYDAVRLDCMSSLGLRDCKSRDVISTALASYIRSATCAVCLPSMFSALIFPRQDVSVFGLLEE